jgi:predicted GIY-YIG superfamily endonuclease
MYTVYQLSVDNIHYFGYTNNLKRRLNVHAARFRGTADGSHYKLYKVFRKLVNDFSMVDVEVLQMFNDKSAAMKYESDLITAFPNVNGKGI